MPSLWLAGCWIQHWVGQVFRDRKHEGKTVIGVRKIKDGLKAGVDAAAGHSHRRSLYVQRQRNKPLDMLATFDLPVMTPNCEVRKETPWQRSRCIFSMMSLFHSMSKVSCMTRTLTPSRWISGWGTYQKAFAALPTSEELQQAETFITGMEGVLPNPKRCSPG